MSKIGFTTSRSPAKKTRSFVHDIIGVVPQSTRIVRGSARVSYVLHSMENQGYETAIIISSVKGNPNFVKLYKLSAGIEQVPYAIKLRGLTLSREYQKKKRPKKPAYSILISSLDNAIEEDTLRLFLGISQESIENIEKREYVTVYADYLDKEEGLIFVEFLDKTNKQTGPRIKLRIVKQEVSEDFETNVEGVN